MNNPKYTEYITGESEEKRQDEKEREGEDNRSEGREKEK